MDIKTFSPLFSETETVDGVSCERRHLKRKKLDPFGRSMRPTHEHVTVSEYMIPDSLDETYVLFNAVVRGALVDSSITSQDPLLVLQGCHLRTWSALLRHICEGFAQMN